MDANHEEWAAEQDRDFGLLSKLYDGTERFIEGMVIKEVIVDVNTANEPIGDGAVIGVPCEGTTTITITLEKKAVK